MATLDAFSKLSSNAFANAFPKRDNMIVQELGCEYE
jgi:hypothetical protein